MSSRNPHLPAERVKLFARRSDLMGAWLVFHVWAVIIASITLFVVFPNPITFIFAFLMVGSRQHGLSILMHEASHRILFRSPKINDAVGRWLIAAPYGGDMDSYRHYHLKHHRYTQSDIDPDLPLSAKFPVTRGSLARKFLRDLSGFTALRIYLAPILGRTIEGGDAFKQSSIWPKIIMNIALFAIFLATGHPWLYLTLWILPLMTWFFAVLRLRNIAEHAMTTRDDNPLTHARTIHANLLERIFFAPYWVNYHVEHHAFMYVPCYNFPKLHKALHEAGHGSEMEIRKSYFDVLTLVSTPQPETRPA